MRVVASSVSFHRGWDGGLGLASGLAGWPADGLCDDGCGGGACDRGGAEGTVVVSGSGGDEERGDGRLGML